MGRTAGSGGSVPAVWLPSVRTGSGTDNFTERLVEGLTRQGYRAEIAWLPLRTEFAPWSVPVPPRPAWANVLHVNSWMSTRFVPANMPVVANLTSRFYWATSVGLFALLALALWRIGRPTPADASAATPP